MPKIIKAEDKNWLRNGFFIAAGGALFTAAWAWGQRFIASRTSA